MNVRCMGTHPARRLDNLHKRRNEGKCAADEEDLDLYVWIRRIYMYSKKRDNVNDWGCGRQRQTRHNVWVRRDKDRQKGTREREGEREKKKGRSERGQRTTNIQPLFMHQGVHVRKHSWANRTRKRNEAESAGNYPEVYFHACMCVCIYIYIYIHTHIHIHTYVYAHARLSWPQQRNNIRQLALNCVWYKETHTQTHQYKLLYVYTKHTPAHMSWEHIQHDPNKMTRSMIVPTMDICSAKRSSSSAL
jgi:hypothetical protein